MLLLCQTSSGSAGQYGGIFILTALTATVGVGASSVSDIVGVTNVVRTMQQDSYAYDKYNSITNK